MNDKSSTEKTLPVGLCGEFTTMAFVLSENAASSSASDKEPSQQDLDSEVHEMTQLII